MTDIINALGANFLGIALVIAAVGWAIGYVIQSWRGVFNRDDEE